MNDEWNGRNTLVRPYSSQGNDVKAAVRERLGLAWACHVSAKSREIIDEPPGEQYSKKGQAHLMFFACPPAVQS